MTDQSPTLESTLCFTLQCTSCTREQRVYGEDEESCQKAAHDVGWRAVGARLICPKCPAVRERKKAA